MTLLKKTTAGKHEAAGSNDNLSGEKTQNNPLQSPSRAGSKGDGAEASANDPVLTHRARGLTARGTPPTTPRPADKSRVCRIFRLESRSDGKRATQ